MEDKKLSDNKWICVQAYKHDGQMHRQWSPGFLVAETDEYWAIASRASLITESDGRRWLTKENAVFLLFKHEWINVICMFKESGGICYYTNMATPTILDDGYLRYIDYDLDLKLYPDKTIKALDEQEFASNVKAYGYPKDLVSVVKKTFDDTRKKMEKGEFPFNDQAIIDLYTKFLKDTIPFLPRTNNQEK